MTPPPHQINFSGIPLVTIKEVSRPLYFDKSSGESRLSKTWSIKWIRHMLDANLYTLSFVQSANEPGKLVLIEDGTGEPVYYRLRTGRVCWINWRPYGVGNFIVFRGEHHRWTVHSTFFCVCVWGGLDRMTGWDSAPRALSCTYQCLSCLTSKSFIQTKAHLPRQSIWSHRIKKFKLYTLGMDLWIRKGGALFMEKRYTWS